MLHEGVVVLAGSGGISKSSGLGSCSKRGGGKIEVLNEGVREAAGAEVKESLSEVFQVILA